MKIRNIFRKRIFFTATIFCLTLNAWTIQTKFGKKEDVEKEPKIQVDFCAYHFKESINVYLNNLESMIENGYQFRLSRHSTELTDYPVYVTIEVYTAEKTIKKHHVLIIVPISTDKFTRGVMEGEDVLEFKFLKVDVPEDITQKHLEAIHEFTFSVPSEEYEMYLVPSVLKENIDGELKFEFKPALNLKTIPKRLIPGE